MSRIRSCRSLILLGLVLTPALALAQSTTLSLQDGSSLPGGTVPLNLVLAGGTEPSGIQWTIDYLPADFTAVSATAGPAATAAGKTINCYSVAAGSLKCVLTGINATTIGDGVVATVSVTLSGGLNTRSIQLTGLASSLNGSLVSVTPRSATIVPINPPVVPSQISCSSLSVLAPGTVTCTVTLSGPAPAGGYTVALSSNNLAATVPASLTIPAGSTSGTFTITVASVTSDATAVLTASANGAAVSFTLNIIAPPLVSSLTCTPATLLSNGVGTCTVTLNKVALSGGQVVTLASDNTSLTVPASVIVAAGNTSATFSATAGTLTSSGSATVAASANGSSRTFAIALSSPAQVSTMACSPASVAAPGTANCTVTLTAVAPAAGITVNLSSSQPAVTVPSSIPIASGSNSGAFTATVSPVASNGTAVLTASDNGGSATFSLGFIAPPVVSSLACAPTTLSSAGISTCTVTLNKAALSGGQVVTLASDNTSLTVPASVIVAAGNTSGTFPATAGTITSSSSATVSSSANSTTATSSIALSATPLVSTLACNPTPVLAPGTATCTATLTTAAPAAGLAVALSSNLPSTTVPASISIPAGATSGIFTASVTEVTSDQTATISAGCNGSGKTTQLPVIAPPTVSSLACIPSTLTSGATSTCTVVLTKDAPVGGSVVSVSDNSDVLTVPSSLTFAAGQNTGTFIASAGIISNAQPAVVTAGLNGVYKTSPLSLVPPITLTSLSCAPSSIASGAISTCTATVSSAPTASLSIQLSVNNPLLTIPSSTAVAASATTATFTATAGSITTASTSVVTATLNGSSQTASLALTPVASGCPCSIWDSNAVPTTISDPDTAAVDLGLKFRSKVPGYVTGVRFYKSPTNTGTHVGRLWNNAGKVLAAVVISGETPSGWQQANFNKPIAIKANTTYVIAYRAPKGQYSVSEGYFSGSGVEKGPLYALRDGEDGGNGTYHYGTAAFPADTFRSSNYWVDVVFNTSLPAAAGTESLEDTLLSESASSRSHTVESTRSLACAPRAVRAGESFTCELALAGSYDPQSAAISLESSTSNVRVPAAVRGRAGQRSLSFRGLVEASAPRSMAVISLRDGSQTLEEQITILPASEPVLAGPVLEFAKPGDSINFIVSAQGSVDLPVQIVAADLPRGATFQPETGRFDWTPGVGQQGDFTLAFKGTNPAGFSAIHRTRIVVGSTEPVIDRNAGLACSPGAIASLNGKWFSLADDELSDPTGSTTTLGGTTVLVNGTPAPVLYTNRTRVDFLCPSSAAGTPLSVTVETPAGKTPAFSMTMVETTPRLLTAHSQMGRQGAVTLGDSDRLAATRDFSDSGEPARIDDLVSIRATGINSLHNTPGALVLEIGGVEAPIRSILPATDAAGVVVLNVRVPMGVPVGDSVPVRIKAASTGGSRLISETVTIAIEN